MKIKLSTTITNQKNNNLLHKVKKFFIKKTKPLANDSFEKNMEKKAEKKVIISRKHPNWCDMPEDGYKNNTIAEKRCYFKEDIEKMKYMTEDEAVQYSIKLDKEGKFYDVQEAGSLKELEKFLHSCGKELKDVLVKD